MTQNAKEERGTVAELRALEAKATKRPWQAGRADMISYDGVSGEPFKNIYADDERGGKHPKLGEPLPYTVARGMGDECLENAQLIAALRNVAPELLRIVEAARTVYKAALRHDRTYYVSPGSIAQLGNALECLDGKVVGR